MNLFETIRRWFRGADSHESTVMPETLMQRLARQRRERDQRKVENSLNQKVGPESEFPPTLRDVEEGRATPDEFVEPKAKPKKPRAARKSKAVALAHEEKKARSRKKRET